MKILLVGSYRYEIYAPAFAYGFRQLGHEVVEIDYEQYHIKGDGFFFTLLNKFQDRYHYGTQLRRYNRDIIDAVEHEKPEIVFLYRCYHVYNTTLKAIRGKAIVMSYNNDDPFSGVPSNYYYRSHLSNSFFCDLNFVYRKKNIDDYSKIGVCNTKILLPYYLSWQNIPVTCKKSIPLAFIGHYENDGRDYCIKRLIDEGFPVQLYGGDLWKQSKYFADLESYYHGEAFGDEYNRLINKTKVLLVFFSKHNHDTYTRRCFEIPASKGVMLSEYTKDMDELFPAGDCAIYFNNPEELIERYKKLIARPEELERISENSYRRLHEIGGSELDRVKEIIECYNEISKNESHRMD